MREALYEALEAKYAGEIAEGKANVEVYLRNPAGIGEPATAVVPAAIANAIDDAVGARVRSLPITADAVKAAMA